MAPKTSWKTFGILDRLLDELRCNRFETRKYAVLTFEFFSQLYVFGFAGRLSRCLEWKIVFLSNPQMLVSVSHILLLSALG
ncbi:MAG: hypothetical protein C0507_19095 [Cyanobacteria bacterium PR.3.49]|nr:hypothetical protein [Cyanobacteria bacterium PR.3.49]